MMINIKQRGLWLFKTVKDAFWFILDIIPLFYSFFVYSMPITFNMVYPTTLAPIIPKRYLLRLIMEDLGHAVINRNQKLIAGYYQVIKQLFDRGTYIPATSLRHMIEDTSRHRRDDPFGRGFKADKRIDFLKIGVESLLRPHPDQAKEPRRRVESLGAIVMVNSIFENRLDFVDLLLQKYPELVYALDSYGCMDFSVHEDLINYFVQTEDAMVLDRFMRYPFLMNSPRVRNSILAAFVHHPEFFPALRAWGALEDRPTQHAGNIPNVHDAMVEENVRKSVAKLKEGKTAEQIVAGYEAFKAYTQSDRFITDVTNIAQTSFGEGFLGKALKTLSPAARETHLYHSILGDGTPECPGLIRRMEGTSSVLRNLFKEYTGLVWLAIHETAHLLIFQSQAAQLPTFDKHKELTEIRLHVLKRFLDIQHMYLGQQVFLDLKAPVSFELNHNQIACNPGTLGHIINILTLIDDRVIVCDEELTPALDPHANLAHNLVAEDYGLLRSLIGVAYDGLENLQPLDDLFDLLSLEKVRDFSQADYVAFFENKELDRKARARTYQINFVLQQMLGKLKKALGADQERTAYIALEDALKGLRIDTLGSLVAPILDAKRPVAPRIVETFEPMPVAAPATLQDIIPNQRAKIE